jgi:rifampin ADP-ribosylating transferase
MAATNEGPFIVSDPCPVCRGQGAIDEQPCATCHGTGVQRFFHGTKADLKPGDLIGPGYESNFGKRKKAGFVYLTGTLDAATWGAELAVGDGPGRIYIVEPTGPIEDDPNLTDKKFPGNPTKSYRSREPLRVAGEITVWEGHAPEQVKAMKDFLAEAERRGIEAIDD